MIKLSVFVVCLEMTLTKYLDKCFACPTILTIRARLTSSQIIAFEKNGAFEGQNGERGTNFIRVSSHICNPATFN